MRWLWPKAACTPSRHCQAHLCDEDRDWEEDGRSDGLQLRLQLIEPLLDASNHRCVERIDPAVRKRDVVSMIRGAKVCQKVLCALHKRCTTPADVHASGQSGHLPPGTRRGACAGAPSDSFTATCSASATGCSTAPGVCSGGGAVAD